MIAVTPYSVRAYDGVAHGDGHLDTASGERAQRSARGSERHDAHGAGGYLTDPWRFTATANYNNATGDEHDNIDKADAAIVVTPYSVAYDGGTRATGDGRLNHRREGETSATGRRST